MLTNSFIEYSYGVDFFLSSILFYGLIFPIGYQYSLDHIFFKDANFKIPWFSLTEKSVSTVVGIHLPIVYFIGGVTKATGPTWWNGESIWRALHNDFGMFDLAIIDSIQTPWPFILAGWATIVVELFYPVFVNLKHTRLLWISLTIGMHISIILFMGLFHFGCIMILFNLLTYYIPHIEETEAGIVKNGNNQLAYD